MCYDISLHSEIELTKQAFPQIQDNRKIILDNNPNIEHLTSFGFPNYPVVANRDGDIILTDMEWSVNPSYQKDTKLRNQIRIKMANAKSERVLEDKKSYWYRIRKNRCLIPMSGSYEHREIEGWKTKVPYYIWLNGRDVYHVPGFYQVEKVVDIEGQEIEVYSFALLTREANEAMKSIHNSGEFKHRMPLYLTPELEEFWLSPHFTDEDMKAVFNYMLPPESLAYHTVYSVRGRTPRPDGQHKFDYWEYPGLPPLGLDQAQTSMF